MAKRHIRACIEGLLNHHTKKELGRLFKKDGQEVYEELKDLQVKGHKYIPSSGCKHFDPFENGCECHLYDESGERK